MLILVRETYRMNVLRASPKFVRSLYFLAAVAVLPFVIWNGFIQQVNTEWSDLVLRFRSPAAASGAVGQVVLLAIDDRTASRYGPLPLNRRTLAAGLRALAPAGPRVLAVDLLLSERGDPKADAELADALREFPRLILGAALESDGQKNAAWILPLPSLAALSAAAHVHAAPDPDGDVRSVLLAKEGQNRRLWALGLEGARLWRGLDRPVESADSVSLGPIRIPASIASNRILWINYAGPEGTFQRVSFASLIEGRADPALFRDKLVILGVTAQGSGDRLFTPVSTGIGMSGIEIHANVIRTILDEAFLQPLGPAGEFGLGLFLICTAVLAIVRLRGTRLLAAFALAGIAVFGAGFAGVSFGWLLPIGSLLTVLLIASTVAGVSEHAILKHSLAREIHRRKEYAFRVQAIAHEIKTPLTAIQGSSEMISEAWVPEEQRIEMAGLIHKESKRLTTLVRTFLSVERLASGAIQLEKRPVDLLPLCEEVAERGRLYAARKNIQVELRVPAIHLRADPDLLSFALYNLITNGVKYSPKNTTVLVSAEEAPLVVRVSVSDEGYGILPAEREKIFEKFYRLRRDEKGSEEGTGIGLALVKEIVQQHGGEISVDSRPNAGSRFTMTVPKE